MLAVMFAKRSLKFMLVAPFLIAAASQAESNPVPLSGPQIMGAVVGNSIGGYDEDNDWYWEYFGSDGVVSGLSGSARYTGWWRLAGDTLCLRFPLTEEEIEPDYEDPASDRIFDRVDCYRLRMDGANVHFIPHSGNEHVVELRRGMPDGLR